MTVHFSPKGLARIQSYRAEIEARIERGHLTQSEGSALILDRVRQEAGGAQPHRVHCATCGTAYTFVGNAQTFSCCGIVQSVWDQRAQSP